MKPKTFTLEQYARNSFHYFQALVDAGAQPYFNVFITDPAVAVHDWPDFGDVASRQLQGVVMGRVMTGERLPVEDAWMRNCLGYIDPANGLLARPATNYSNPGPDPGDAALTLYALATAFLESGDPALGAVVRNMVDGVNSTWPVSGGWGNGFIIKSLMVAGRALGGYAPAFQRAADLCRRIFSENDPFTQDNRWVVNAHMHGSLRTLVGAADYALYAGDAVLYSRVAALYEFIRAHATRFGFIAESHARQDDVITCETCALMDWMGLAVTLANHGHPEYWGDVERLARNHLVESQLQTVDFIHVDSARADTDQFTWRDLDRRMLGAYAGWSSPNHFLGAVEKMVWWGGPEIRDQPRLLQNCCGGSGTHAFFIAWKNAARVENGCLDVNLHIDKRLPEAEIRGFQPYQGKLTICLEQPLRVRVRIPEFTSAAEMQVRCGANQVQPAVWANYLDLGPQPAGEQIEIRYPLRVTTEEIAVGNPGFQNYRYRVTWKGDTVLGMEPLGEPPQIVYSAPEKGQVRVFYGADGPGPLYQRAHLAPDVEPELSHIQIDLGALDLWKIR
jgi:hypothetical protein